MLPESSSRPLPAKKAHSRNLAHASLKTAVYDANLSIAARPQESGLQKVAWERFTEVLLLLAITDAMREPIFPLPPPRELEPRSHGSIAPSTRPTQPTLTLT